MRDLIRWFSTGNDFLPLSIPDIVSNCLKVDAPEVAEDAFVEVLASQDVKMRFVRSITHVASSSWELALQTDIDPAITMEISVGGILLAFELLLFAFTTYGRCNVVLRSF